MQSGASTIQSPCVSSPCVVDELREQRVVAEPAPEAGRADHLLGAVHLGRDPEAGAGPLERLVPGPAGRVGRREQRGEKRRALGRRRARGSRASPRREKSGRGTLSGRRTGSRRRTDVTRAPAASAFSHSVAAAIPAPTTATSSAYSCGS